MKYYAALLTACFLCWLPGCAAPEKPAPRMPLSVSLASTKQVIQATDQGIREYKSGLYEDAKTHFQQAVAGAPQSGAAHYNLGLALFALGETDEARGHFIEAANLEPGNKVIWDSPALRPYGDPEPNVKKKVKEYEGRGGRERRIGQ
jgi:tetratricopeptide (TPR) repeat protein